MKVLRLLGTLLLFIVGISFVLSMILPAKQTIEKTIRIQAPVADVYKQISKLEHFNSWSVWNRNDSTVRNTISGTDGSVGATTTWKGDPVISGEGSIEIVALEENNKVEHVIRFQSPRQAHAQSYFTLTPANNETVVTWTFDMKTPRPWNIFNLFYSMDREMGNDFEQGLVNLKSATEKSAGNTRKTFEVEPMNYPATTYAIIRQRIQMKDIEAYSTVNHSVLDDVVTKLDLRTNAVPHDLFFDWDENSQQTDMAVAVEAPAGTKIEDPLVKIISIPASKAISVTATAEELRDAYASLDAYMTKQNITRIFPIIRVDNRGVLDVTEVIYLIK